MLEVLRHPYQILGFTDVHTAAGHIYIAARHGIDNTGKRHIVGAHSIQVEFHMDFPFQTAADASFQHTGDGFNLVL